MDALIVLLSSQIVQLLTFSTEVPTMGKQTHERPYGEEKAVVNGMIYIGSHDGKFYAPGLST